MIDHFPVHVIMSALSGLIGQGWTSYQTHYRSYRGLVFRSQMTQPTVSKHWRKIRF